MIARARRAVPGVIVTLFLAGPALAAHSAPQAIPRRISEPQDHRKTAGKSGAMKSSVTKNASHATARGRVVQFASHRRSGTFRHEGSAQAAFVDDGAADEPQADADAKVSTWQQTGLASWYGGSWHGRPTSSGDRYDQDALTAAHASLPLGTKVRVVLNGSARSVIVTINDRPGTRRRVIDLSRAAAQELGILDRGLAMVTLIPL